ncbi:hypothetical protein [Natrinema gelatinilyticum]|uniref:hypothetical protein n=1 Tax=Natrinema gelatinilyticum TaxID=2961571 RepID=UPI0020C4B43E|nr:hypothetical protein [Natrinema gelatinilyticum]
MRGRWRDPGPLIGGRVSLLEYVAFGVGYARTIVGDEDVAVTRADANVDVLAPVTAGG